MNRSSRSLSSWSTTACVVVALALSACGGGGGGTSSPPPVYTGITGAATLDNTLQAARFASAMVGPSVSIDAGIQQMSAGRDAGIAVRSVKSAVVSVARNVASQAAGAGGIRPLNTYNDVIHGVEGGTATITTSTGIWTNNGVEYVTRIDAVFSGFDDTADGVSTPLDGSTTIVPHTWYGDGTPVYYTASLDLRVTTTATSTVRAYGSLDYSQMAPDDFRIVFTWQDVLLIDARTGVQIWLKPLIEIDEDYMDPSRDLLTVSGKIYVSYLGFANITPVQPFDYPTAVDYAPISGSAVFTGAAGGNAATIRVQGTAPQVTAEIDLGRNGSVDDTASFTWQECAVY